MKEFNLELAKAGYSVQTRDGRPVRILCYDVKGHDYPIMALVTEADNKEMPYLFTSTGHINNTVIESRLDLFMAPTKKEGWVNIYPNKPLETLRKQVSEIYDSEKEALRYKFNGCIATTKIEWEE